MKFGKLESTEELRGIDFTLPPPVIEWRKPHSGELKVYSGGTTWNVRPWRGKVYPQKEPMRTWPTHYGNAFSTIEFNATHYKIYSPEKMADWANQLPEDFKFCPKFPAIISHYRRFNNCDGPTDDFIEGLLALEEKLGPAFLQLPPHFAPKHREKLLTYLESWPRELKMSVEFRHPEWFTGGAEAEVVWSKLSELGIGAVISDTAGRRDALHMRFTAPHILVRFGGYSGHATDECRLSQWADLLKSTPGIESFYLLVHTDDSVFTPETCEMFDSVYLP